MNSITPKTQARIKQWLTPTFDAQTQAEIQEKLKNNPSELEEAFYKDLAFGTGGMRGIMGVGTNRINPYTLGKNTQGISNYLQQVFPNQTLKVAIAFDCRNNSKELAKIVANVFSANQIHVFLFEDLRPTPELSFAVKHLNCHCGIVLTASHNPPEYNGYKVYWQDGGQLVPPQDREIINEINKISYSEIKFEVNENLIQYIGKEIDEAFIQASILNGSFKTNQEAKNKVKIVVTSLHGTSITILPQTLEKAGYNNVYIVEEQRQPNGNFPTVKSPNPEEPEALKMALDLAKKTNADIVIGTDPDSDRVGIAVRDLEGKLILLNGNQTMMVMTNFLLQQWQKQNQLKGSEFIATTIVSTPMMQPLADAYNVALKIGLTGFKWIAKMIEDFPDLNFVGGGEESFGYMVGDFVRDKDAITAALLACEIVAQAKEKNSSFYQELITLYNAYGCYKERLVSITKKGISGAEAIQQIMKDARENPVKTINNSEVIAIEDYLTATTTHLETKTTSKINLPKSNVLIYYTKDGSKIALRPSGTEPKIKYYISVVEPLLEVSNFKPIENKLEAKIDAILANLNIT